MLGCAPAACFVALSIPRRVTLQEGITFTRMLWGGGSNSAVAACAAQGDTGRTGKGAV